MGYPTNITLFQSQENLSIQNPFLWSYISSQKDLGIYFSSIYLYINIYWYIYIYIARLNNPFVKLHGKIHPPPDNKSCQHNHSPRPRRPASRNPRSPNNDPRMPPTRPGKVIPMPICNEISETQRVFRQEKKAEAQGDAKKTTVKNHMTTINFVLHGNG